MQSRNVDTNLTIMLQHRQYSSKVMAFKKLLFFFAHILISGCDQNDSWRQCGLDVGANGPQYKVHDTRSYTHIHFFLFSSVRRNLNASITECYVTFNVARSPNLVRAHFSQHCELFHFVNDSLQIRKFNMSKRNQCIFC